MKKTLTLFIIIHLLTGCFSDKSGHKSNFSESSSPIPNRQSVASNKHLLFESLFEKPQTGWNSWEGGDWNGVEATKPNAIIRTSEQSRSGKYSAKFVLIKSEKGSANDQRAELTDWDGRMLNVKSERWYGLSIYLPSSFVSDPCEEQLFQWHGDNSVDLDGISMSNSPLAMYTINGNWEFGMRFGGKFDLGLYEKNSWTDWVLHIKFSPHSDGLVEIWKNGKKVLTKTGKNTYNDVVGNYFKIGIYKYGWADGYVSTTNTRTIYYDDIRVGNENSSFSEVVPKETNKLN